MLGRKRKWIQVTPRPAVERSFVLTCGCGWRGSVEGIWEACNEAWNEHERECLSARWWGWEIEIEWVDDRRVVVHETRITERPVA